jgi:hypothetical protein
MTVVDRFDTWVFRGWPVTAKSLGTVRILYAGVSLLVGTPHWTWAGRLPGAVWNPEPGPLRLLPGPPGPTVMVILQLLFVMALVALLVGWRTPIVSVAVTVIGAVGFGITYALGNYDHSFIGVLTPAVLAPSGWGAKWSVDAAQGRVKAVEGWPVRLLAWLLGLAMLTSAYPKVRAGWLDIHTHAVLGQLANQYFVHGRRALLATQSIHLHAGAFWEVFDDLTIVVEGGFVIAVLTVAGTRLWAAMAAVFHAVILLMINIPFSANLLIYVAFVDWSVVTSRLPRTDRATSVARFAGHRFAGVGVIAVGLAYAVFCAEFGAALPALLSLVSDRADFLAQIPLLMVGGVVGLWYLLRRPLFAGVGIRRLTARRAI